MALAERNRSQDKTAALFESLIFYGFGHGSGRPEITSGSYPGEPSGYAATATGELPWKWVSQSHRNYVPVDFEAGYFPIKSPYPAAISAKTSTDESDNAMTKLAAAAEMGNEQAFLVACNLVDWERRSPDDVVNGVQWALAAGAHLAARRLAFQGAARFPDHAELKKYGVILAPPKIVRRDLPLSSTLKTNRDWLTAHATEYQGQWVALSDGKLVGAADTLDRLAKRIANLQGILFTKVF